MDDFVHLEVQSAYSFLWGTFTPETLVERVAGGGQRAVALTDRWSLHGSVRFSRAALQAGIQPILGARISLWDDSWVTLLVQDRRGYGNLCRLISSGEALGRTGRKRVLRSDLRRWSDGLICLAGGRDSRTPRLLEESGVDAAAIALLPLKQIFSGPDRLFLILENHGLPGDRERLPRAEKLARRLSLPTVATNTVAFLAREDFLLHRMLVGIQQRHHHRNTAPLPCDRFELTCGREMAERIPCPQALANTARISQRCRGFSLPGGRLHPPRFTPGEMADQELARSAFQELARKGATASPRSIRRLDRELSMISRKGLSDLFLLVREVVDFARARGIRHSVRGSASGSLVVHLLLGGVDPLAHDLLFERFINEGRSDMPDVDIDFDSERRDEVLAWLMERLPGKTAMVATIHTFRTRSAVRLAARALGFPLEQIGRLTACLPWALRGIGLDAALERFPELKDSALRDHPPLVSLASRLAGLPFQTSVHAGGVILAPDDITAWTPVRRSAKGFPLSQLDKDDVEALGLLKLDILGLRMHTALRRAEEVLRAQGRPVDLEKLPLDDAGTYSLLRSTESLGVFQLESPGQRHLLGRLQPGCFGDLVAEISLFRPGPVKGNMVESYVLRKAGKQAKTVPHPDLRPILAETYGVIVFQEQVLRIVHTFAGLSYSSADAFRRAMTKGRSLEEMEALRQTFLEQAVERGHDPRLAEAVFQQVAAFAAYGFCKAHAAAFAHLTYQSAWLKTHHPLAFYLGLLNAGHVGSYPPSAILNEARRRGIPISPPHVNASGLHYAAEGKGIRVPLVVIRGIGPETAGRILEEREGDGLFESREDFLCRVSLAPRIHAVLAASGAMEGLPSASSGSPQEDQCPYYVPAVA